MSNFNASGPSSQSTPNLQGVLYDASAGQAYIGGQPISLGSSASTLPTAAVDLNFCSEGDSITAGSTGASWVLALQYLLQGNFRFPYNFSDAAGGKLAATMATNIPNITALNPAVVTFLGGTNDLAAGVSAATVFGYIQSCVNAYIASGAQCVLVCKVFPRNDATWTALADTVKVQRRILNNMIDTLRSSKVLVLDMETQINPTTDTVDGLHLLWATAKRIGLAAYNLLATKFYLQDLRYLYLDSSNIALAAGNVQLTGTTGTMSGTQTPTGVVATGWTVTENGGMTVVCSKVANFNDDNGQEIVVSGTNSTLGTSCKAATALDSPALAGVMRSQLNIPFTAFNANVTIGFVLQFLAGTVAADVTIGKPYVRRVA